MVFWRAEDFEEALEAGDEHRALWEHERFARDIVIRTLPRGESLGGCQWPPSTTGSPSKPASV